MGFLLLAILGLGVVALSNRSANGAATGAGGTAGGPPAVDPATANPALGGPRTQTISGVVALTAPWASVAIVRLGRYAPTAPQSTINGLPGGGGAQLGGSLVFKDDLNKSPPDTLLNRSVLKWIREQNAKGLAIVVSDGLVTGPFTEDVTHTTLNNPFLPGSIVIKAVPLLALPTVAAPGQNMAVLSAVPGSL